MRSWTRIAPVAAAAVLAATWGRYGLPWAVMILVGALLCAAVLAAVHHAEVVAHRVGEPLGSLILAVAVTVIEVGLILMLMSGGGSEAKTLARDTVFAAVMITMNLIVGASILAGTRRGSTVWFNAEGAGSGLTAAAVVATLCLVLPTFTLSARGPEFTPVQLLFAATASAVLYASYVFTQTVRHRHFFLPVAAGGDLLEDDHADPPSNRQSLTSLGLLLVSLVAVVGLAKVASPAIESAVAAAGLPQSFVGVVIALLVLGPETIASVTAARRGRMQNAFNLAYGSAMASVGLTIPTLAIATIWLSSPLHLGLGTSHIVLLAITIAVSILTVVPGRAVRLQGVVHLVLGAAFIALSMAP